jgi:hypothetical protein
MKASAFSLPARAQVTACLQNLEIAGLQPAGATLQGRRADVVPQSAAAGAFSIE